MAFQFWTDAALTQPLVGNLPVNQQSDGSTPPVQFQLWLGDDDPAWKYEDDTNPGVANILVSIIDAAPGSGNPVTDVKLATSQAGLPVAVAGDPLDLGATVINGGSVNARQVWIEADDSTGVVGTSTELSTETQDLQRTAV